MGYRSISTRAPLIKWDEPKVIEGTYRGAEERSTDFGENIVHTIVLAGSGEVVSFFGTTQLNEALKQVQDGTKIRVEYTGKKAKTSKGFFTKVFEIGAWEDDAPPG